MTAEAIRTTLERSPLFRHLDSAVLDQLAQRARRQGFETGEIAFHLGDPASHFFILEEGLIKLARSNPDGQEKVVHLVRPGETFAEAVMFMEAQRYPVTAEALEPSRLVAIPNGAYRDVLLASPNACMHLLADLSMRLHSRLEDIDQLTLQQARPRVVRYLLTQATGPLYPGDTLQLPAPKHVVASRLSMTPETLSRILHELSSAGLIQVRQRDVIVNDPDSLRLHV